MYIQSKHIVCLSLLATSFIAYSEPHTEQNTTSNTTESAWIDGSRIVPLTIGFVTGLFRNALCYRLSNVYSPNEEHEKTPLYTPFCDVSISFVSKLTTDKFAKSAFGRLHNIPENKQYSNRWYQIGDNLSSLFVSCATPHNQHKRIKKYQIGYGTGALLASVASLSFSFEGNQWYFCGVPLNTTNTNNTS